MKRRDFVLGSASILSAVPVSRLVAQARPCMQPNLTVRDGSSVSSSCNAEGDWLLRSGQVPSSPQPGVVWFHDFRSDAEVNAFRWTGGIGNDPNSAGALARNTRRLTTDGVTGACLEILRPAGTSDNSHWWRPLSPIVGSGNGRGMNDPGANGTVTVQPYAPTQGGGQIQQYGRRGYYAHPSYHNGSAYDGTEYYLQMRVKMDPRRTTAGNIQGGKLMYQTITDYSLTGQEIVTYSGAFRDPGVGSKNIFRMYGLGSFSELESGDSLRRVGPQVGSQLANYASSPQDYCQIQVDDGWPGGSINTCWAWSGGWDTVLYHLVPGRHNMQETHIEVWVANEGQTQYTKIWDEIFTNLYDARDQFSQPIPQGYNAIILSAYQNGLNNSEFWHRYCQLIFSKQFIPCPQA